MGQLLWGMDTVSLVHGTATVGPKSRGNGGFTQKGRFSNDARRLTPGACCWPWGAVVVRRVCCSLLLLTGNTTLHRYHKLSVIATLGKPDSGGRNLGSEDRGAPWAAVEISDVQWTWGTVSAVDEDRRGGARPEI